MSKNDITIIVISVLGVCFTFGTALWKAFSAIATMRESMNDRIQDNAYQISLLNQRREAIDDQRTLAINGLRELIEHRSDRLRSEIQVLQTKSQDMESWLAKNTEYTIRGSR